MKHYPNSNLKRPANLTFTGSRLLAPFASELSTMVFMGLTNAVIVKALSTMKNGPFNRNVTPNYLKHSTRIVYVSQARGELLF